MVTSLASAEVVQPCRLEQNLADCRLAQMTWRVPGDQLSHVTCCGIAPKMIRHHASRTILKEPLIHLLHISLSLGKHHGAEDGKGHCWCSVLVCKGLLSASSPASSRRPRAYLAAAGGPSSNSSHTTQAAIDAAPLHYRSGWGCLSSLWFPG